MISLQHWERHKNKKYVIKERGDIHSMLYCRYIIELDCWKNTQDFFSSNPTGFWIKIKTNFQEMNKNIQKEENC